eukprot:scaffold630278_cov17-Prasinocladus_malaysianus.AAC.1
MPRFSYEIHVLGHQSQLMHMAGPQAVTWFEQKQAEKALRVPRRRSTGRKLIRKLLMDIANIRGMPGKGLADYLSGEYTAPLTLECHTSVASVQQG